MSNFVHMLAFSTNGHIFYSMYLVDYSMSVHNAVLLFLLVAQYFVWVSIIYFISPLLIVLGYFQSCGIKNSAATKNCSYIIIHIHMIDL